MRPDNKTQYMNEKKDSHQYSNIGFQSERQIPRLSNRDLYLVQMSGLTERSLTGQNNISTSNFYLYKNLIKFIQSLDDKISDLLKPRPKKKVEEKYIHNPYIKELNANHYKKAGTPTSKALLTISQTGSPHHFGGKIHHRKT